MGLGAAIDYLQHLGLHNVEQAEKTLYAYALGHHCTEPIMDYFKIPGTVRASLAVYNNREEIDKLVTAVKKAVMLLR